MFKFTDNRRTKIKSSRWNVNVPWVVLCTCNGNRTLVPCCRFELHSTDSIESFIRLITEKNVSSECSCTQTQHQLQPSLPVIQQSVTVMVAIYHEDCWILPVRAVLRLCRLNNTVLSARTGPMDRLHRGVWGFCSACSAEHSAQGFFSSLRWALILSLFWVYLEFIVHQSAPPKS